MREVTYKENSKNLNNVNIIGYTGLNTAKNGISWYSKFMYGSKNIKTSTKYNLEESKLDNLITQRYLGYKHNEDEFYKIDDLTEERIGEVEDLIKLKINNANKNIKDSNKYEYDVVYNDGYCILTKNNKELILDNTYLFSNKCINKSKNYWQVRYTDSNGNTIRTNIHRDIFGLKPNEYEQYYIHVDHLNKDASDNRIDNLIITSHYSNLCNKTAKGYRLKHNGSYVVQYMCNYKFWDLICGIKQPTFKTEQEAINEVNRRRNIIDNARVKLKSKLELEELIQYCLDNGYTQENGLADLDLGYLYWRNI